MDTSDLKAASLFKLTIVMLFITIAALATYFHYSFREEYSLTRAAIAAEGDSMPATGTQTMDLTKEKSRLESENAALKAQVAQFESEKNIVLSQVRASVKAFDDYRQHTTRDMAALSSDLSGLQAENQALKSQTGAAPAATPSPELEAKVDGLEKELAEYRETISYLRTELEAKQETKIVEEAGKLHYNVGNFYFRNKQYTDAVAEYQKALLYSPNDPDTHYNLAVVSDEYLGDRQLGLTHYKQYLALGPSEEHARSVENRVLDLELYETVLAADKNSEPSKIKWLDPTIKPKSSEFTTNYYAK